MKNGLALVIFTDINSDRYSDDDKIDAIKNLLGRPIPHGVTKAEIMAVLNWLLNYTEGV